MKGYIKYLSVILAVIMAFSSFPFIAIADTDTIADDLQTAKSYIDNLTVDSSSNIPSTVVSTYGTQFTWDNEKRESNNKSYLFEWSYYNGVVFEGLEYIYDYTGTEKYRSYVESYLDAMVASNGTWAYCTSGNTSKEAAGYVNYHGADCYKTASLLLDMCKTENGGIDTSSKYYQIATTLYGDLTTGYGADYTKSDIGYNYYHSWSSTPTYLVWLDGIYMIQPFMAEYAYYTNDTDQLDKIAGRFNWYYQNGREAGTNLYYHAISSASKVVDYHWSRGIGWYAMALVDCMQYMSGDNLATMKTILQDLVDTMITYQDSATGMWANLCDQSVTSTNKLETSGTAMLAYTIAKAVNKGWLSTSYSEYAKKAFSGIVNNKLSGSTLSDIYFKASANGSNNYETSSYYYSNEGKGIGPFIMAYAAVSELVDNENNVDAIELTDTDTGLVLSGTDISGLTVTETTTNALTGRYKAYDISLIDYTQGKNLTISIPLPDDFTSSKTAAYYIDGDTAEELDSEIKDGFVTFTTNHLSTYAIAETDDGYVYVSDKDNYYTLSGTTEYFVDSSHDVSIDTVKENTSIFYKHALTDSTQTLPWSNSDITTVWDYDPALNNAKDSYTLTVKVSGTAIGTATFYTGEWIELPGTITTITYTPATIYVLETSAFSNDTEYLIAAPSNAYVMAPTSSSVSRTSVTINNAGTTSYYSDENGTAYTAASSYIVGTDTLANYEFTKDSSGYIYNSTQGKYLYRSSNSLTMSSSKTAWTTSFSSSAVKISVKSGSRTYYVRYSNSSFSISSTNSNNSMRLFKKTTVYEKTETQTEVTAGFARMSGSSAIDTYLGSEYTESDVLASFNILYKETEDGTIETIAGTDSRVTLSWDNTLDANTEGDYVATVYFDGTEMGSITVSVSEREPVFPEPGAVKLDKTADGTYMEEAGVARVELNAISSLTTKPIDVLFITDLSNSMVWGVGTKADADEGSQKLNNMQDAVSQFTDIFLANNTDGSNKNNTISFVTFAGLDAEYENTSGSADFSSYVDPTRTLFTSYDDADAVKTAVNNIRMGTGYWLTFDGTEGNTSTSQNYGNTNYDYAFMEGYNAVAEIKQNYYEKTGQAYDDSDREIYILFVTDGAPTNYNGEYYNTNTSTSRPDNNIYWINESGTLASYDRYVNGTTSTTYSQATWYSYICSTDSYWATKVYNLPKVGNMAVCGIDLANGGFSSWVFSESEGTYNLKSFVESIVEDVTLDTYLSSDAETLASDLAEIAGNLAAASSAYVIDTLGDGYNVLMTSTLRDGAIKLEDLGITPHINITTYESYHLSDVDTTLDGVTVTEDMIGEIRPGATGEVIEGVTFNDEGTESYSTLLDGNILSSDIITAKNFVYNGTDSAITLTNGINLPAKSFYWNIGKVPEDEIILDYYVYLDGSMEGVVEDGVYQTNKAAILVYTNKKGVTKETEFPVPEVEWSYGIVNYELYYVDIYGNPIDEDGSTVSFENRIVVEDSFNILSSDEGSEIVVNYELLEELIPEGYIIFNPDASLTANAGTALQISDTTGTTVVSTEDNGDTTVYTLDSSGKPQNVENYNVLVTSFAIVKISIPNTQVVIDYGLPVSIHTVSAAMATALGGGVQKIGTTLATGTTINTTAYESSMLTGNGKNSDLEAAHGTFCLSDNNIIVYTPTDMSMTAVETIYFEYVIGQGKYFYGTVTVIPATIMYYEDDKGFITYNDTTNNQWKTATGIKTTDEQDESRPGVDAILGAYDADDVYGYDNSNVPCTTFSLGSAHYITVGNGDYAANGNKWPTAQFTFTGTAFDLIAMSSSDTGFTTMMVYEGDTASGTPYKQWIVDTYYGYTREIDGYVKHEWYYRDDAWHVHNEYVDDMEEIPDSQKLPANIDSADTEQTYITYEINYNWTVTNSDNNLYQIPVLRSCELPYGTYTVVVQPCYTTMFDHNSSVDEETGETDYSNGSYDFYLDAVRTYAPAEDYDEYNELYYTKDGEGWPQFFEIRNNLIDAGEIDDDSEISGAVFIDSVSAGSNVDDFRYFGPNNEIYLAAGQSVAFSLTSEENDMLVDTVQISAKKLDGEEVTIEVNSINDDGELETPRDITISCSSDMYYKVCENLSWSGTSSNKIVVTNISEDAMVSLTRIKVTFKESPAEMVNLAMTPQDVQLCMAVGQNAYIASISECYHDYSYTLLTAPTDTETGIILKKCSYCEDEIEIIAPVLGSDEYVIVDYKDSTETEEGYIVYQWADTDVRITVNIPVAEKCVESLTFFGKIKAFFDKILSFFKSLFRIG